MEDEDPEAHLRVAAGTKKRQRAVGKTSERTHVKKVNPDDDSPQACEAGVSERRAHQSDTRTHLPLDPIDHVDPAARTNDIRENPGRRRKGDSRLHRRRLWAGRLVQKEHEQDAREEPNVPVADRAESVYEDERQRGQQREVQAHAP